MNDYFEDHYSRSLLIYFLNPNTNCIQIDIISDSTDIRSTSPSGNGPSEDRKSFRGDSKKLLKGVKSFTKSVYKDAKTKFH